MIDTKDYDKKLQNLGIGYFIDTIEYVPDLIDWAEESEEKLSEPFQLMKLTAGKENKLSMLIQSEIREEALNNVIKALSMRWVLKDVATDPSKILNSVKKRLVYCFLKEYARTLKNVGGDELQEDEWSVKEMEKLGYFNE